MQVSVANFHFPLEIQFGNGVLLLGIFTCCCILFPTVGGFFSLLPKKSYRCRQKIIVVNKKLSKKNSCCIQMAAFGHRRIPQCCYYRGHQQHHGRSRYKQQTVENFALELPTEMLLIPSKCCCYPRNVAAFHEMLLPSRQKVAGVPAYVAGSFGLP